MNSAPHASIDHSLHGVVQCLVGLDANSGMIVRELLAGSRHYNELLRGLPGISRSVLVARLRLLADSDVLQRREGPHARAAEYVLTEAGRDLARVIDVFGAWGARWAFGEPRPDELDPVLLLWKMHRRVHRHLLPPTRTVVEFDLGGRHARRLWLVMERSEVSLCLKPPGFTRDMVVRADVALLYQVWVGKLDYHTALQRGLSVDGPRALVRALPHWWMWSPMARFVRAERRVQRAD